MTMKHIFTSMASLISKIALFGEPTWELTKNTHNSVTVWCGFWAGGIIFFENEADQAATVNGARYRDMITQFFLPKLDDIDVANM